MRIEKNKLIFEKVPCNMCEATGKTQRGIYCKFHNKPMYGKTCACGSRNKFSHKIVSYEIVECMFCNGTGTAQEDKFTRLPTQLIDTLIEKITFSFRAPDIQNIPLDSRFIADCYSSNSFAGSQDYIDHTKSSSDLLLAKVLKQVRGGYIHQALNYIDSKNNLLLDIQFWGYNGGWTAKWASFQSIPKV